MCDCIWIGVPDYEGLYEISTTGLVRSIDRVKRNRWGEYMQKGKLISAFIRGAGYPSVILTNKDGVRKTHSVHRLVLHAFTGTKGGNLEVRHINGIPNDNRIENLQYGTHDENMKDMVKHGRSTRGDKSGAAKLREKDVLELLKLKGKIKQKDAGDMYGIHESHVSRIWSGKYWGHLQ